MNRPSHDFAPDAPVLYDADAGDAAAFETLVSRETFREDVPHAAEIAKNVPLYDGPAILNADRARRDETIAEWTRVFETGPGVVVIKRAYSDTSPIDRATELFDRLIEEERDAGSGGGDHFAKPGANDRIWNALEKHCLADPEGFALYFGNPLIAMVSDSWLGPGWQMTAQVNRVNPGGAAQIPHRDYHLGFMSAKEASSYPVHVHRLSAALTLQGAIAHCDMPVESGPTMLLPYSQLCPEGYVAFRKPEFQEIFAKRHVQLPLEKGDVVFFNPALMHGAGENRTNDMRRMANLLQVSSAFGRPIETVDRAAMARALYAPLSQLAELDALTAREIDAAIAVCAEGYAFPTNLDTDPPVGGLAPKSQAAIMLDALVRGVEPSEFESEIDAWVARRSGRNQNT